MLMPLTALLILKTESYKLEIYWDFGSQFWTQGIKKDTITGEAMQSAHRQMHRVHIVQQKNFPERTPNHHLESHPKILPETVTHK